MATILPGSPPTFDKNDIAGTVKALCNYTRILQENIDFTLGQLKKELSATQQKTETLESGLSAMDAALRGLSESHNALAARVSALEKKII
ncbi:MAG: hypothetical protein RR336_05725 [Oscillospiraceae bacterium]